MPAASVDVALAETEPSAKEETSRPENVTAPAVGDAVRVTREAPLDSVSVTVSVPSQDARATETDSDVAFPLLTYAPPAPPPFASEMPEG